MAFGPIANGPTKTPRSERIRIPKTIRTDSAWATTARTGRKHPSRESGPPTKKIFLQNGECSPIVRMNKHRTQTRPRPPCPCQPRSHHPCWTRFSVTSHPHFLVSTDNDLPTARHAAGSLLAVYNSETEEELRLATDIVSFGFHALEALSEAMAPDVPVTRKLRLRGSAVSLSREAHKSQRKLDQLQRARRTASPQPEIQAPTPEKPGTDQALALIEFAREALEAGTRKATTPAWTPNRQQRRAAERITENLKRNKAEQARRDAAMATHVAAKSAIQQAVTAQ
jgi:hypothetical protein